jgi:hypothetical protein
MTMLSKNILTRGTKRFTEIDDWAKQYEETKDVTGWLVETIDGYKSYVLIENNKGLYDNQSLEAVAVFIDCLQMARKED